MKNFLLGIASLLSIGSYAQSIGLTTFATGFSSPLEITHPAGDARLFVVEQGGKIKILNPNQTTNPTNFLTLTSATISTGGERGLLGLAFHPNYATNGFFFINYTNTAGNTVIARYSVSANPNVANTTGTILLTIEQPYANHNGGTLRFGADGYLYIGMGDGGSGGDPGNRAQNINVNLGKMLRLDVDSGTPYGIPPTNPYAGAIPGNDEIWAIGMRNPWKYSFDMLNGDMWIADVGQDAIEEINHIAAPVPAGLNFGWKCYEANSVYTPGCAVAGTTYTFPVAQYPHDGTTCSITGGYVYRGSTYPNLYGKFLFADYCSNKIGYLDSANAITWSTAFSGNFTTFGQDINGEMYVAGGGNGIISRITDTTLSTTSFAKKDFQIYPNPAKGEMFVKSEGMAFPAAISIFDISGKLLISQSLSAGNNPVATGNLQSGIYMVKVKDNAGADYNAKLTIE